MNRKPQGSGACPTFFRAQVLEAQCGGSFADAGYHLGLHARDLVAGDVPERELRALDAILDDEAEARLWTWLERNLPRCAALVPEEERDAFLEGLLRAANDGGP